MSIEPLAVDLCLRHQILNGHQKNTITYDNMINRVYPPPTMSVSMPLPASSEAMAAGGGSRVSEAVMTTLNRRALGLWMPG